MLPCRPRSHACVENCYDLNPVALKLAGWLLVVGFLSMERLRRGQPAKSLRKAPTDRGTSILIMSAYALALLAMAFKVLPSVPLSKSVAWGGIGLGVAGFALRFWAMRVLGRFYTRTLLTTRDQHVVQDGPYRLIRHPGYLGSLLIWIGASASSGNLLSLMVAGALLAVAYAYRITIEERMLIGALGDAYRQYRSHSWRLVPFVF
jgi:protein-S-isoprenylcysteine O-methyltransferase Ste14